MIDKFFEIVSKKGWQMGKMPDKCLKIKFPDYRGGKNTWELLGNANKDKRTLIAEQWGDIKVPPFSFAVFWNGWLAGIFNPKEGQLSDHPEGANAETFLKSLELVP